VNLARLRVRLARALAAAACAAAPAAPAETILPPVTVRAAPEPVGPRLDAPAPVGSRLGLTIREIPAAVEVIEGETIRERGFTTTQDAVTRATGISSAASPGNGGTALSARGFAGHGSVMQLYDGSRFYVGAGTVTFPVDTWPLERIEVLRGPASVLFGEGAIGGVINYVPKKPAFTSPRHEGLLSYGSRDTWRAALGSGGALGERVAYRVDGVASGSDGFVDRGQSDLAAGSASLAWRASDALMLTLAVDASRNDPARYWGTPVADGALREDLRRQNYNVRRDDSAIRYEDLWMRARAEYRAAPNVLLRNEVYRVTTDRHWRNLENYVLQPGGNTLRRSSYLEIFHDQTQVGNRFDAVWDHRVFGLANRVAAGFDVNRIDFTHTNNAPYGGVSVVNPSRFDPGPFLNLAGTLPKYDTRTDQYAFFVEDRLSLTGRLTVIGGLRTDRLDYRRTELVAPTGSFDRKLDALGWRIGAVYALDRDLALYAQAAEGTDPVGSIITLPITQRDFNLSRGRQYEAGVKQSLLGGRAEWTLAVYEITKNDLLTRDPADPARVVQIGQQSSRGVELAVGVRPARAWQIDANLAVLDAKYDDFSELVAGQAVSRNGNLPPNVPERVGNLWVTHAFAPAWRAGGGLQYVGRRAANNANTVFAPSYTTVDAFVSWNVARNAILTLRGRNLTDEVYAIGPYNAGTQFILGAPRSIELEARMSF
jgi:iron complex outermembrane receptor protein